MPHPISQTGPIRHARKKPAGGWVALATAMALLATACMGSGAPAPPVYYFTLSHDGSPETPRDQRLPYVLRVDRFTAAPPYDTRRIIYADEGLHRNAYASSQWIAPPGDMLAFLIARHLQQAQVFQAVLTPDELLPTTHIIRGSVEEFLEDGRYHPARASIRVTVALIDTRRNDPTTRIVFQQHYEAHTPCAEKTPAGLARAMSETAARLGADIRNDIIAALP